MLRLFWPVAIACIACLVIAGLVMVGFGARQIQNGRHHPQGMRANSVLCAQVISDMAFAGAMRASTMERYRSDAHAPMLVRMIDRQLVSERASRTRKC